MRRCVALWRSDSCWGHATFPRNVHTAVQDGGRRSGPGSSGAAYRKVVTGKSLEQHHVIPPKFYGAPDHTAVAVGGNVRRRRLERELQRSLLQ